MIKNRVPVVKGMLQCVTMFRWGAWCRVCELLLGAGDMCCAWEGVVARGVCVLAAGLTREDVRLGRGLWPQVGFVGTVRAACS